MNKASIFLGRYAHRYGLILGSLGYRETLNSLSADGTALTAAARASLTQGGGTHARYKLPANKLKVGDVLKVFASGRISSVITTPGTARFDLGVGSGNVAVMDSLAILLDTVAAHSNVGWLLELWGTVRAIGNTGNLMWQGRWTCEDILGVPATAPKGVLSAILPWNSAPAVGANFDTTIDNVCDLNFTQTAATGSVTLHQWMMNLETSTGF